MMGAAAGVAVGAVGGALLMNALGMSPTTLFPFPPLPPLFPPFPLRQRWRKTTCPLFLPFLPLTNTPTDDDDDHPATSAPMQGQLPDETADGSSVSSSDKEDVEEARKAYEEAYEETYGSD